MSNAALTSTASDLLIWLDALFHDQVLSRSSLELMRTWVDDDYDQTRTLAALDNQLARGQRFAGMLDELCRIPEAACAFRDRMRNARRSSRRGRDEDDRVAV